MIGFSIITSTVELLLISSWWFNITKNYFKKFILEKIKSISIGADRSAAGSSWL